MVIANGNSEMKRTFNLRNCFAGAIIVPAILFVGCGKAPIADSSTEADQVEALRKEAASLKSKLASAQAAIDSLRLELNSTVAPSDSGGLSAPDILDELMEINMTSGNRGRIQRRINFLFESLSEQGEAAVPHIREFLNRMEDVDFAVQKSPKDKSSELNYWRTRMVHGPLDFEQPPSLRIGLIDILTEVGGKKAEEALAEVLSTTGRGFEIAYAAKKLQKWIGKDAYRDEALGAAHELLSEPIEVANGNKFDAASRQYLFMVLEMYNDQTFVQSAQGMLIDDDGGIDRTVLDYLNDVGKEQAMDAIYQAFNGGQVTDRGDLSRLARAGLKYTGSNPQANQMFKDIMSSDDYDIQVKWSALREMDDTEDDATLQARLALMQGVQASGDNTTDRVVQMYTRQLEAKVNGEEYDMRDEMRNVARELFSREGGRGGRERGERNRGGDRGNQPTVVPAP